MATINALNNTSPSLTVATGNVSVTVGNISTSAGSITSATSLTATSGAVTITSGNIVISSGNLKLPATTSSSVGRIVGWGHEYGTDSVFIGGSGNFTTTTNSSTGIGYQALNSLGNATQATACGYRALYSLANTGVYCTAFGANAGKGDTTGLANTCFGESCGATYPSTGNRNILVGQGTGCNAAANSSNIYIGYNIVPGSSESNTLRIGNASGTSDGNINRVICKAIYGIAAGTDYLYITSASLLAASASSQAIKQNITDMGADSSVLYQLRPRTFQYINDPDPKIKNYGFIAEEVEEVFPEMVSYNSNGDVWALYYQFLPPMLVNEFKKLQDRIAALEEVLGGE